MDTPRPSPRTNRTRRVPHPVLIGQASSRQRNASLLTTSPTASPVLGARLRRRVRRRRLRGEAQRPVLHQRLHARTRVRLRTAGRLRLPLAMPRAHTNTHTPKQRPKNLRPPPPGEGGATPARPAPRPRSPPRGSRRSGSARAGTEGWTRRVQLVRRDGRDVPTLYGRGGGGGGGTAVRARRRQLQPANASSMCARVSGLRRRSGGGPVSPRVRIVGAIFGAGRAAAGRSNTPLVRGVGGFERRRAGRRPPPPFRTKWTRRVPHPVLIGHAALPPSVLGGTSCRS